MLIVESKEENNTEQWNGTKMKHLEGRSVLTGQFVNGHIKFKRTDQRCSQNFSAQTLKLLSK